MEQLFMEFAPDKQRVDHLTHHKEGWWLAQRLVEAQNRAKGSDAERDALRSALTTLHAMVWGECPSLLNEDSGGNGQLGSEIRELLKGKD